MSDAVDFARFTNRARRVISLAHEQASDLRHDKIYPEHVLLGLAEEEKGSAGRVLRDLGLRPDRIREMVLRLRPAGDLSSSAPDALMLDDSTDELFRLAIAEASNMGHSYVGTEHLLLASILLGDSNSLTALRRLGLTPAQVRRQTRRVLEEPPVLRPTSFTLSSASLEAAESMFSKIDDLQSQVAELEGKLGDDAPIGVERISEIADSIEQSRRELTAPVTLPSIEDMSIRLVPSHRLERLEEYRADEGYALLAAGLFGGGLLGLLVSLATAEISSLSAPSIAVLVLLLLLTVASAYWIHRIRSRVARIRERMLWPERSSSGEQKNS